MKFGIIVFPGSNCDHDAYFATKHNAGSDAAFIWHKETSLPSDIDCVIVPGGFSYGDYLRCGAIARFSPILQDIIRFADNGGYIMGICNGFQILTEAGLLPGALLKNASLHFLCKDVYLKTINNSTAFTSKLNSDAVLRIPIAHDEGNYFAEADVIKRLEDNNQVVFRYSTKEGEITDEANPNGSANNIAGIVNEKGNVLGMMPHPERYSDLQLGCNDGLGIFQSLISNFLK